MAHRSAKSIEGYLEQRSNDTPTLPDWIDGDVQDSDERVVLSHNLRELRHTMWDYVGIVRTKKRLERALTRIQNLSKEINEYYWNFKIDLPLLELRNLLQTAELIVKSALLRKESRGLHSIKDHPEKLPNKDNTIIRR